MTASFADNEIWHVMIADDMKRMNVDQLDDAFRLSLVDASTMVWKAGMKTWARLGSVAGIDDEDPVPLVTHRAPPPPPRPLARPTPKPPSPSRVPQSFHTAITPVFQAPTLVAPVYTPPAQAPDPYVLPKRRVAIPSEVDFRRSSSGVRWARWAFLLLLVTGGVLGAYRQNLLREGARRLGLENKYLHGERRVTAFVSAKAPGSIKLALTRLKLLPGPNAVVAATAAVITETKPVAAAEPAKAPEPNKAAEPAKPSEPEVKTVSLDSLPVLTADAEADKPAAAAPAPVAHRAAAAKPAAVERTPAKAQKVEKPEPVAKSEPKPKAAPPPPANDNPLKAAIRQAILADAAKK